MNKIIVSTAALPIAFIATNTAITMPFLSDSSQIIALAQLVYRLRNTYGLVVRQNQWYVNRSAYFLFYLTGLSPIFIPRPYSTLLGDHGESTILNCFSYTVRKRFRFLFILPCACASISRYALNDRAE